MYRARVEEKARREERRLWKVTPKDREELDWYVASIVGLGA